MMRRLEAISDGLNRALRPAAGGAPTVRWMERTARGQHVSLSAVPLDLAPVLRELLFDRLRTVVLTSATLAAGGEFAFLESRLGLSGETSPVTVREIFASPFDYPSQCIFGVPNDLPEPREDQPAHGAAVVQVVTDLAYASDGGMFVLFTSHVALRRAAQELRLSLGDRWPILVQGESPRDVLLRRFRELENAILLGTDSFWEGVDVPGRALRTLVLNKLPFKVPSEPITAARLERLAEEGFDGFMNYLLPHAALKLKQGFGRLIRSRQDSGRRDPVGQQGRHQAVRPPPAPGIATGGTGSGKLGPDPHQVRRLLCPAGDRGGGMIPVRPSKIIGIGRNYVEHARELGNEMPEVPIIFFKPTTALIGSGEAIQLPSVSTRVEFEAEIGVVIGKRIRHADVAGAERAIGGFVCVNDVTCRDLQKKDGQWGRAKGFDTFCPVGPKVVSNLDWRTLELICRVNGVERQRARSTDI